MDGTNNTNTPITRVGLIGLGAVGAFFAPALEAALGHGQFFCIAGGERKERLERDGVELNGERCFYAIEEPGVAEYELGMSKQQPADLILIGVKQTGLVQALEDISAYVGPETIIMPLLNGIDSEEWVAARYGWDKVLYAYMRVSIVMKDGKADFDPSWGKVHFGEEENEVLSPKVERVKALFEQAGINYRIEKNMILGMWYKFMCNIGENMTCALLGVPFGAFQVSEHANYFRYTAMREVIAIANAKGIDLSEKDIEEQELTIQRLPYVAKPSTLQDLERGRLTELDIFAGKVIKMGEALNIPTPINQVYYHGIRVLEEKMLGKI